MNTRSISEGNFINRASVDSKSMIRHPPPNLISLPKDMYSLFNQFQLTQSRLSGVKQYTILVNQMKNFNQQLKAWKQSNGRQIRNLRMTYYFYQNLYSRIKFINELSIDRQKAKEGLAELIVWFNQQKPKVRGALPKKPQPLLKPTQFDRQQQQRLNDMTQYNVRRREMKPYEQMARTSHTGFFPPKQRLLDYHKKQFMINPKLTIDNDELREQRVTRTASSFKQQRQKLTQTSTTFQHTKTTFRNTDGFGSGVGSMSATRVGFSGNVVEGTGQVKEFVLSDPLDVEPKLVQQEEMMNQLIEEPKFEEDQQGEEAGEQVLEEEQEQEPEQSKYKKVYESDHTRGLATKLVAAQECVKDPQQSTLRRLLKNKQLQIQSKLQELNVKQKMIQWAKTSTFIKQQIDRKSQSYRLANQFNRTQYTRKGFFQRRRQIPQFDMKTQRVKTAQVHNLRTFQQSIQKSKISQALKGFGKYINGHVTVNPTQKTQYHDEIKLMRATSLTAFNKTKTKKHFGDILAANEVDLYNQEAQGQIINLKEKLSKKQLSISKKKIYSALTAVKTQRMDGIEAFPKTSTLFSNPFFPKHLYEKKKKKKK